MSSNSFPDLMTMLIGIGKSIPAIIMLMQLAAVKCSVLSAECLVLDFAAALSSLSTEH